MSRPRAAWTPPDRDGVGASRVAVTPGPWPDLLAFLCNRLPALDEAGWRARLDAGEVLAEGGRPVRADEPCAGHILLWYWRQPVQPEPVVPFEAEVLHLDDELVVADKPHFLPVSPGGRHVQETLLVRLKRQLGIATLSPIHRIDRETAGLVLFSVRPASRDAYQRLLRERALHKVYEAITPWRDDDLPALPEVVASRLEERPGDAFMQMVTVAGEPNAVTRITLIERLGADRAHYRLEPLTGRKHQLRAQLSALGRPIVGDRIYPVLQPADDPAAPDFSRPLQLLARELSFVDPLSGAARHFVSRRQLAAAGLAGEFETTLPSPGRRG
ncbi:MAG: hypothetical protein RLZZ584_548 [Pseudomonadota bacterium]|jgi:tRNA pseudouridine32 synthase/23S rRNA pseudouridine746 synthase